MEQEPWLLEAEAGVECRFPNAPCYLQVCLMSGIRLTSPVVIHKERLELM